ncbi:hypothetical protein FGG08_002262 [Glutinoglossum americanum]|uniref:ATPase AAA-type core domain-containing protein n=1 Tax=Glutinoglossum americanum TaxID=1670608 RepID=A0A9P8I513_9PEZI|nr:hypothetical protein FGG08_002262 [Glutinoglossum americanum]
MASEVVSPPAPIEGAEGAGKSERVQGIEEGEGSGQMNEISRHEQRYIQLLERRIAQLEWLVGSPANCPTPPTDNNSRIRIVVSKYDPQTGIRADFVGNTPVSAIEDKEDIACTFRRVIFPGPGQQDFSQVIVQSIELQKLLMEIVGDDYPGQSWSGEIVNIPSPFTPLVHYWDALLSAAKENPSDDEKRNEARQDLGLLLESVKKGAEELETYFKARESNLKAHITTYETMWSLFVPGEKVIAKPFLNTRQIFVVSAPLDNWSESGKQASIDCWCYDWNGREMVKVYFSLKIEKFKGTKRINELECYPIKYYKDDNGTIKNEEDLCESLTKRGRGFDRIVRGPKGAGQMHSYAGEALVDQRAIMWRGAYQGAGSRTFLGDGGGRPIGSSERKSLKFRGNFIVDHEAFLTYASDSHPLGPLDLVPQYDVVDLDGEFFEEGEYQDGGVTKADVDSKDYFLLLPPRFLGYSTQEKYWGQFKVEATRPVSKARKSVFEDQLQLEPKYKKMIQALIVSHQSKNRLREDRVEVRDVVEEKGKGLVILLHAETVAEATGKPLFVVSVAEIGLDASKAEKNLEQIFALAGSWEAVLLVDEADVFLERRTSGEDANRNALVSVLLRVLEYYQGIMILTTNRITSLDVAVQSRIHLAIRYDDLSREYRQKIFKIFLDQLEPNCIKDHAAITEFVDDYGCDYKLNGRQIRNVVASALALARSSAKDAGGDDRLTVSHLKQVINITRDFQEQLQSITQEWKAVNEVGKTR